MSGLQTGSQLLIKTHFANKPVVHRTRASCGRHSRWAFRPRARSWSPRGPEPDPEARAWPREGVPRSAVLGHLRAKGEPGRGRAGAEGGAGQGAGGGRQAERTNPSPVGPLHAVYVAWGTTSLRVVGVALLLITPYVFNNYTCVCRLVAAPTDGCEPSLCIR